MYKREGRRRDGWRGEEGRDGEREGGGTGRRRNESHPSEQLEQQIDRWALTVRVTLAEGWSKGGGRRGSWMRLSVSGGAV